MYPLWVLFVSSVDFVGAILGLRLRPGVLWHSRRGRKHMLPMGTVGTGPESLYISVAIGLPSFLPSCPVTNTLRTR